MIRETEKWMNLREAAGHLSVSDSFIRKQVRLKRLPHARAGKVLRFRRADLDAWMDANGCGGELACKNQGR